MDKLVYYIAAVLVIVWAVSFLIFQAAIMIHLLLVIAVIVVLLKLNRRKKQHIIKLKTKTNDNKTQN